MKLNFELEKVGDPAKSVNPFTLLTVNGVNMLLKLEGNSISTKILDGYVCMVVN